MTEELDRKLCEKYPEIFKDRNGDMRTTAMCWGFECGDGWYPLIDSLCSSLQWDIENNNRDYVVENKFLRKMIPRLHSIIQKIPGKYNFEKERQSPLTQLKSFLRGQVNNLGRRQKCVYIKSDRYPQLIAVQIKEKFGSLRFYTRNTSMGQNDVISFAESLSHKICEECGAMKDVLTYTCGWNHTLCPVHADEYYGDKAKEFREQK